MRKFLRFRVIGFLVVAILIAVIALISVNAKGGSGFITNSLMSMSKPLKSATASVAKMLESIYGYMYEYDKLKAENAELKAELYQLQQDSQEITEISKENDQLRDLLDLSKRHPDFKQYDTAEVISWNASNWASSFTIGKGSSNSKIKVGDCVITETGALIGIVSDVEANVSTVMTIIDTKFSYGAFIERNDERAIAAGDFTLMKQDLLKFDYLQDTMDIVMGDTIITSGMGGVLPSGLVIGTVQEVLTYSTGISRYAVIKPAADLKSLANVYLITSYETTSGAAGTTDNAGSAGSGG